MRVPFTRPNKSGAKLQKKIDIRKENVEKHKIFSDFYKKREFRKALCPAQESGKLATEFTALKSKYYLIKHSPKCNRILSGIP